MDVLRNKKRTFFSISEIQASFSKKKLKDCSSLSDIPPTCTGDEITEERDDNVFSSSESSSSSADEQGSSCEDIHRISRKQKTLARHATRRDRKREMEQLKKKDKNKISMEDFLSKQTEFSMWLEEEKSKNYREMSSPKRKVYFRNFMKLWNKRKLPPKYYRGSTVDIESPAPVQINLFEQPPENSQLTAIKRPKSKRLSIEQAGFLDSPFSTFGKTPPKLLQQTSLDLLDSKENVTPVIQKRSTFGSVISPVCRPKRAEQVSPILELSEYQIPLNSVRVGESIREEENAKRMVAPYSVTSYPWTDSDASSLKSDLTDEDDHVNTQPKLPEHSVTAVYALPTKPKGKVRHESSGKDKTDSFRPPPVPPKPTGGFSHGYTTVDICGYKSIEPQQLHHSGYDSSSSDGEIPHPPINEAEQTIDMDVDDIPPPPIMSEESLYAADETSGEFPSPPQQFKDKPPSPQKPKRSPHTKLMAKSSHMSIVPPSKLPRVRPQNQSSEETHYVTMMPVSVPQPGSRISHYSDDSGIVVDRSIYSTVTNDMRPRSQLSDYSDMSENYKEAEVKNRIKRSVSEDSGVQECGSVKTVELEHCKNKLSGPTYWRSQISSEYAELDPLKMENLETTDKKSKHQVSHNDEKSNEKRKQTAQGVWKNSNLNIESVKTFSEERNNTPRTEYPSVEPKVQFGSLSPFICTRRGKSIDKKSSNKPLDKPEHNNKGTQSKYGTPKNVKDEDNTREGVFSSQRRDERRYDESLDDSYAHELAKSSREFFARSPLLSNSIKHDVNQVKSPQNESRKYHDYNKPESRPDIPLGSFRPHSPSLNTDNIAVQNGDQTHERRRLLSGEIGDKKSTGSSGHFTHSAGGYAASVNTGSAKISNSSESIQIKKLDDKVEGKRSVVSKSPGKVTTERKFTEIKLSVSPQDNYLETDIDSLTSNSDEVSPKNDAMSNFDLCQSQETVIW